jgi:hypothetical protein
MLLAPKVQRLRPANVLKSVRGFWFQATARHRKLALTDKLFYHI